MMFKRFPWPQQRPGKAEDNPPFERFSDLAQGRVPPIDIDLWSELTSGRPITRGSGRPLKV